MIKRVGFEDRQNENLGRVPKICSDSHGVVERFLALKPQQGALLKTALSHTMPWS